MQKKKPYLSIGMAVLLIAMTVFLYLFTFNAINKVFFNASVDQTLDTLEVTRGLGVRLIEDKLSHLKSELEDTAATYSVQLSEAATEQQAAALAGLSLPKDGLGYWLARPDGSAAASDGSQPSWKTELDLEPVFAEGKTAVIDPYFNEAGDYIFSIAAPVRSGEQVNAVLILRLDGFCISRWIEEIQFDTGEGVAYIVNSDGRNIASSREENYDWITSLYNAQELADSSEESKTVADLERLALEGRSGRGSYLWEGSRNYLVYAPVEATGWGFYLGFYGELINDDINASARKSILSSIPFFLALLTFFLILIFYANYNLKKEKGYVKTLLLQKQEIEEQTEALIVNEKRFRVALAQTSNIIFEYDPSTESITNFYTTKIANISNSKANLKEQILLDGIIDEESLALLQGILNDTRKGIFNNECTIRVVDTDESVSWYKVSISPLSEQQTRVIGIIEDITKEKLAELDPMTGLLNKKYISEQIVLHLQDRREQAAHAFLMFDIDDFKTINDHYGHPVGDQVIVQTGGILKQAFPPNALVGRIGGDEFCVYCFEVASAEELEQALELIYGGRTTLTPEKIPVTYSCGIALCGGNDSGGFEELYKKADEALYQAKTKGKNQYCFYTENN